MRPCNLSASEIEAYTNEIIEKSGKKPGDPLGTLVKALGGRINFQDLDQYVSKKHSLIVNRENEFDIYLGEFNGIVKNNFRLAHELGHYFLHSNQGRKKIKALKKSKSRAEQEANTFALSLLMPRKELLKYRKKPLEQIAAVFFVPINAVEVWLKEI